MKRFITVLIVVALFAGVSFAADHNVSVVVEEISTLNVTGGNITLTITGDFDDVTNTACGLNWSTNASSQKVTVATNNASQSFSLTVGATGVSGGSAAGTVTLSTTAADFVTSVSGAGSCGLTYTASATAGDGTGTDNHTVTYTITAS